MPVVVCVMRKLRPCLSYSGEAQEEAPRFWREVGLSPIRPDVSSSEPSGSHSVLSSRSSVGRGLVTSTDSSSERSTSWGGSVDLSSSNGYESGFSTDVSEGQRERRRRRLRDNQDSWAPKGAITDLPNKAGKQVHRGACTHDGGFAAFGPFLAAALPLCRDNAQ